MRRVTRRYAVPPQDAEDFESWAQLKLIENDYAVLRRFERRSKLSTYLNTVVARLFLDYRNAEWGKWRASAAAKRLGTTAIQLESLVYRDGHTLADAIVLLRERLGVQGSDEEFEQLFVQLEPKLKRRFEGDTVLAVVPADDDPERDSLVGELEPVAREVSSRTTAVLETLEPRDRLILRMRFLQGMKVSDISRMLDLEQRSLYPLIDRLLRDLKTKLEKDGVTAEQVRSVLGWDELELRVDFGDGAGSLTRAGRGDGRSDSRPRGRSGAQDNPS